MFVCHWMSLKVVWKLFRLQQTHLLQPKEWSVAEHAWLITSNENRKKHMPCHDYSCPLMSSNSHRMRLICVICGMQLTNYAPLCCHYVAINALVCRTLAHAISTGTRTVNKATVTMIEGGAQRTNLENYYSRRRVWPTSNTR